MANIDILYRTCENRNEYLNNHYKTPPERFSKKNGEGSRGHSQKL